VKADAIEQLQLWNENPMPWPEKMKRDAHAIAFPGEKLGEDDVVNIDSSWADAQESWGCGEGTCYQEGSDANFWFTVKWSGRMPGQPRNSGLVVNSVPFNRRRDFEGAEAVQFFFDLMLKGSNGSTTT
jgi:hypothetical protein